MNKSTDVAQKFRHNTNHSNSDSAIKAHQISRLLQNLHHYPFILISRRYLSTLSNNLFLCNQVIVFHRNTMKCHLSISAVLLILLSLFAISTVNAQAIPARPPPGKPATNRCVTCIAIVPACNRPCPAGTYCKVVPQTCKRCAYAYCARLPPPRPVKPRPSRPRM
jgi:hypothetical protein